jgi:hypothetical protein
MANSFKNMMREVMNMAHRAFALKGAYMTWAECLKQAWQVIKLKARMKKQVVEFYFQKMNGEVRQAFGTLMQEKIDYVPNGNGKTYRDCIKYWDMVKGEWRQFKNYNLIRVA